MRVIIILIIMRRRRKRNEEGEEKGVEEEGKMAKAPPTGSLSRVALRIKSHLSRRRIAWKLYFKCRFLGSVPRYPDSAS